MTSQLVSTLPTVEGLKFQDVAKEGLEFGDEGRCFSTSLMTSGEFQQNDSSADNLGGGTSLTDEDEDAKEEEENYKTQFGPLAKYIEKTLADSVEKGKSDHICNRFDSTMSESTDFLLRYFSSCLNQSSFRPDLLPPLV